MTRRPPLAADHAGQAQRSAPNPKDPTMSQKPGAVKLTESRRAVLRYLADRLDRDPEKGGDGMRPTRDVAEYLGISISAARARCWALADLGFVQAFDAGASGREGNPIEWRATPAGRRALEEQ